MASSMSMSLAPTVDALSAEARAKLQVRKEDVPELHKTRLCRYAQKGHCKHGSACTFAHTRDELTSVPDFTNTKICTSVVRGRQCTHKDCPFAHSYNELRPHPRPGGLGARRKGQPVREKEHVQQQQQQQQQQRVQTASSLPGWTGLSMKADSKGRSTQDSWQGVASCTQPRQFTVSSPPGLPEPSAACRTSSHLPDGSWEGSHEDGESRDTFVNDFNAGMFAPDTSNNADSTVGAFDINHMYGSYEASKSFTTSPEQGYASDWMKAICAAQPMAGSIHSTYASLPALDEAHGSAVDDAASTTTRFHLQGGNQKETTHFQQESPTLESCRTMSWTHRSTHTGSDLTPTSVRSPTSSNGRRQLNKEDSGVVAAQIQELRSILSIMTLQDEAKILRLEA